MWIVQIVYFFFFNDTATTEIYTLSLHDALPISRATPPPARCQTTGGAHHPRHRSGQLRRRTGPGGDRKSTRLNSSHSQISYAVFCLKKKKTTATPATYLPDTTNSSCTSTSCATH